MPDKNLFPYDLAVVAIIKNEAPYLTEWLDYHLIAGVEHFYLYDNAGSDNQAEVVKPYVAAGLVDYFHMPGKMMQVPAYNEAIYRFRFHCRYMTFIDADEFIFPKTNRSVVEVVDEILSPVPDAGGVSINWQMFGSNGHETADLSRGVLERFTRRAPSDWAPDGKGNAHTKIIADPRKIHYVYNPHCAKFFANIYSVNEQSRKIQDFVPSPFNLPVTANKIVVNHYYTRSREEFANKIRRGRCNHPVNNYNMNFFAEYDRNEVFDDGILKYRAARAENFTLEDSAHRLERVIDTLTATLTADCGMEAALTCRAVSSYLRGKFPAEDAWRVYEEASLGAVLKSMDGISVAEAWLLFRDLPNILRLPYSAVKELRRACLELLPQMSDFARLDTAWQDFVELKQLQYMLEIEE